MIKKIIAYSICISIMISINYSCKKKPFEEISRNFYMGATPYPPDYTDRGDALVYNFINTNCDLIAHHFDDGVPWEEALNNTIYPQVIIDESNKRISKSHVSKVYLSLAPLTSSRNKIAGYWSKTVVDSVKNKWKNKEINDSLVVRAYFNYCCYMIDKFNPNYFNYAIECNSKEWTAEDFNKFLDFCSKIYPQLKQHYPTLPIFVSYVITQDAIVLERAKKINQYSDYISVSTYPYVSVGSFAYGPTDVGSIPSDWFSKFRDIDASKPFSIAETGYIAEDLNLSEYGITKIGKPEWQADYVQFLFETCNKYNAEFVNWFCPYDYDNGYNTLQAIGAAFPLFKEWKDTGLYDGNGLERPSLKVWDKWYKAKKNN